MLSLAGARSSTKRPLLSGSLALGGGGALLVHGILRRASAARADAALRELAR
ncbi:MAG: hypothetical protein PGN24_02695 [Microbacterium arborescens]